MRRIAVAILAVALVAGLGSLVIRGGPGAAEPAPPPTAPDEPLDVGDRTGALLDEVVFTQEPDTSKVVELLSTGTYDAFASSITNPSVFRRLRDSPHVTHSFSYGTSDDLGINTAGPEFSDGRLNPFHSAAIREALNKLIDRQYIAEEIYGGLAVPRHLPLHTAMPDYARLADVARKLELRYGHDPEAARETIERELRDLGAEQRGGEWFHDREPIEIIVLIRTEDQRQRVGDYIANLMEDLGFRARRLYRTADEASRIWVGGDPHAGQWHLYTGAWVKTMVERDSADDFNYFYTPRGRPEPLWQTYETTPEFDELARRLERRDYAAWDERQRMMARATELAMEQSARLWLVDRLSVWPRTPHIQIAGDLAGGISGSRLWPYTIRFTDRLGGRAVVALSNLLTEPWNPIAGTNWIFDQMIIRALGDHELMPDPYTGLYWPQRVAAAEVTVQEDAPVRRTHDWVTVETRERIDVPDDAWIDWDAAAGTFISVGEKHDDGLTARTRTRVTYEEGYLDRRWHDGTRLSLADVILPWIITFERADEASPLFDRAYVPMFEVFQEHFRGWRIVSHEPLVIEIYSDQIYPDAEVIVAERAPSASPWHVLTLGVLAERNGDLAFSSDKADRREVNWMSMIAGPSLDVLARHLAGARDRALVPYPQVLSEHIDADAAERRYAALADWHGERGHFWVGDGPFYLHSVHPVEQSVVLRRFEDFPDPADKWLRFTEPRIPELDITGPMVLEPGEAAAFELRVTFADEPYPSDEIDAVQFMLFDGVGELAHQGEASEIEPGLWRIALEPERIEALGTGANSLEIAVTAHPVALPAFTSHAFATVPGSE